jgi:hypothetical protein
VDFRLTDDQRVLRTAARELMARLFLPERLREHVRVREGAPMRDRAPVLDRALWREPAWWGSSACGCRRRRAASGPRPSPVAGWGRGLKNAGVC